MDWRKSFGSKRTMSSLLATYHGKSGLERSGARHVLLAHHHEMVARTRVLHSTEAAQGMVELVVHLPVFQDRLLHVDQHDPPDHDGPPARPVDTHVHRVVQLTLEVDGRF